MFGYLALSLLLLVVMAWFILQPFLVPATASTSARTTSRPPVVTPPKNLAAPVAAATATAAAAPTAAPAATTRSTDDVRASVEAAIAARNAAMVRHACVGCCAPVELGDWFCRACGTRGGEGYRIGVPGAEAGVDGG